MSAKKAYHKNNLRSTLNSEDYEYNIELNDITIVKLTIIPVNFSYA